MRRSAWPDSSAVHPAIASNQPRQSASVEVVVGPRRLSVSAMMPPMSTPAVEGDGWSPSLRKRSATIVDVEPTGLLMKKIGCCGGRIAQAMVIDDFQNVHLIGSRHGFG